MTVAAVLLPPADDITTAVLKFFETVPPIAPGFDSRYAGDATKPPPRYWILYRIPGGASDALPTMDDFRDSATFAYQLTCVGATRHIAERLSLQMLTAWGQRDRDTGKFVRTLGLPSGWAAAQRLGPDESPGVDPTGQQPTTTFQVPLRLRLTVTPA